MFANRSQVAIPASEPPRLLVVIDTEEEFDWSAPPDRQQTGVGSMAQIDRIQSIFDRYGIVPCYVVDYPVVDQAVGRSSLQAIHADGRCEIGAHLHPWVTPPFDEPLTLANMYPGNLPAELERSKLLQLRDRITDVFGCQPSVYKAGRYGFGPATAHTLDELGFTVDVSLCASLDSSIDGGPDYSAEGADPFWFGDRSRLLELPVTGAFVGWAGTASRSLYGLAQRMKPLRAPGILARTRAVDRLILSPEGYTSDEHRRLTRHLLDRGTRVFTWSLHSPSVEPGHTPYVRSAADLQRFLDSFHRFFDHFFGDLGGIATTPTRLRQQLEMAA